MKYELPLPSLKVLLQNTWQALISRKFKNKVKDPTRQDLVGAKEHLLEIERKLRGWNWLRT